MRIRAYATLRELLGGGVLDVDLPSARTVGDVLRVLVTECPAFGVKLWDQQGNFTGFVTVLVNGRAIEYLLGVQTPVSAEDTIALFPPVGGG